MNEECVSKNTEKLGYDSIDSVMQMLREVVLTMLDEGVNVNNILKYMGIEYGTVVRSLLEQAYGTTVWKDEDTDSDDNEEGPEEEAITIKSESIGAQETVSMTVILRDDVEALKNERHNREADIDLLAAGYMENQKRINDMEADVLTGFFAVGILMLILAITIFLIK